MQKDCEKWSLMSDHSWVQTEVRSLWDFIIAVLQHERLAEIKQEKERKEERAKRRVTRAKKNKEQTRNVLLEAEKKLDDLFAVFQAYLATEGTTRSREFAMAALLSAGGIQGKSISECLENAGVEDY